MRARLAAALLGLCAASAAADYAPRADVDAAAQAARLQAQRHADAPALTAALAQAQQLSEADALAGEARMQALLLRLRELPTPPAATRAAVESLRDYAVRSYTDPLDPEHRGRPVPAFAIAGAARAALAAWERDAAEQAYRAALARADLATLRAAEHAEALAALVRTADAPTLALLRAADPPAPQLRLALFERLADPALAQALLRAPADGAGLRLIAALERRLPPQAAFALLSDPALDAGYVSAARLALGRLVAAQPQARAHLLATLGDAWGASSAQALAIAGDPQSIAALAAELEPSVVPQRLRNALLGLHLAGTPQALQALRRFAEDTRQPPALRSEIRAWLP